MNLFFIFVISVIIFGYILGIISDVLEVRHLSTEIPDEFQGFCEPEKYKKSQLYLKENLRLGFIKETLSVGLALFLIISGAFNVIDLWVRQWELNTILTGLLFFLVLSLATLIIGLPFSIYHTFYIEQKYEFNKTTVKTFILDFIKGLVLSMVLGGIAAGGVLWFFEKTGPLAWLYTWIFVSIFQFFIVIIAPIFILPLFNKFEDLEPGELKDAIMNYMKQHQFAIKGIYKMDGSKRSTKSNAFFTGVGRFRRIVLFDTLIEKHSTEELVAVLAHELGHYKKKHLYKGMFIAIVSTGLMFFCLSLFINNPSLFAAFKMQHISIYASLIFFSFIYSPIEMILGIFSSALSRKFEYEADRFAVGSSGYKDQMILALKRLYVDNMSNLTPHWLKVVLGYAHPPVIDRIKAIRQSITNPTI